MRLDITSDMYFTYLRGPAPKSTLKLGYPETAGASSESRARADISAVQDYLCGPPYTSGP